MASEGDLYDSLYSALSTLGVPARDLVVCLIESRGIAFRPHSVDLNAVDRILAELFGMGSGAILDVAKDRLDSKILIGFDDSRISHPVEKIRKWIEVNSSREKSVR